ncbi:MAG TPA: DUF1579 family protein [Candidatus Polarisedimenticolia bacterium]|nr:DUF1579 family protein [Candidatus Polarisedimenticolia bacterium]
MHAMKLGGLILAAALPGLAPAAAMTVDEVIARNIEARGGAANWSKVESIAMSGDFTAFSKVAPFELKRTSDDKYYFDHMLDEKRVVIGYDGEVAWWDHAWMMPGPQTITGIDRGVLMQEVDFPSPLFDYREKGYKAKLIGGSEFEGTPSIAIELTRPDESVETWHLDPETYLEIGRISPGSDFGSPMEQRTYYDDYRKVDGVVIPFLQEWQWYTRDRVLMVEKVELNAKVDETIFAMPPPPGMSELLPLVGSWDVKVEQTEQPGGEWAESSRKATIEAELNGGLLQERYATEDGDEAVRNFTYDRFENTYRITMINGRSTQLDVCEGAKKDGRIVVTNLETGVKQYAFGGEMQFHHQVSVFDITADGFKVEHARSRDGGENWFTFMKLTYTRAAS